MRAESWPARSWPTRRPKPNTPGPNPSRADSALGPRAAQHAHCTFVFIISSTVFSNTKKRGITLSADLRRVGVAWYSTAQNGYDKFDVGPLPRIRTCNLYTLSFLLHMTIDETMQVGLRRHSRGPADLVPAKCTYPRPLSAHKLQRTITRTRPWSSSPVTCSRAP